MFSPLTTPIRENKKVKTEITAMLTSAASMARTAQNFTKSNFSVDIPLDNAILLNVNDFNLLDMDNNDDQMLMEILMQTERSLNEVQATSTTVTSVQQNINIPIPVVPWMYFPNTHVTINYNFGK